MSTRRADHALPTARRFGPGKAREWSAPSDTPDGPYRFFVFVDPDDLGLIELEESKATSAGAEGRPLRGGSNGRLVLSVAEARWLLRVLPEAVTYLDVHLGKRTKKKKAGK